MAGNITLTETFTNRTTGLPITVTSVKLSDPTGAYGVKRNDTDVVVVADATAMVETATGSGIWEYEFAQPADSLTYTYWVEYVYNSETFRDKHTLVGTASAGFDSSRDTTKYLTWIAQQYLPLTLATPTATLEQLLENSFRYFNTHSAHRIIGMYDYAQGAARIQLDADVKMVYKVYPSGISDYVIRNSPAWSLLGFGAIGYGSYSGLPSDLIQMDTAYRDYAVYLGRDFRHTFVPPTTLDAGGYLYVKNLPREATKVCVFGAKRVTAAEDIVDEFINEWILKYFHALVKQIEGNTLRKAGIIGVKDDGGEQIKEGREEQEALEKKLAEDGRWAAMIRRF